MLAQFKSCRMTKVGTMVLPAGRLSYPALDKPRAMPGEPDDKAKYQTSVILPADADLKMAIDWVNKTAIEKWGPNALNGKPFKRPFLKHAEKTEDAELAAAFPYMLRCSSNQKPAVIFANGDPCSTPEEIYPGRWACVSIRAYAWEHPTGGRGVSFGLSNCMLLDHDERLGGGRAKAEDEFEGLLDASGGNGAAKGASADPDSIFG